MSNQADALSAWELSYYTAVLPFRGGRHVFPKDEIVKTLGQMQSAGIRWVGFDGINMAEYSEVPFAEVVAQTGEWLERFGLRVSSLHYGGPTHDAIENGQESCRESLARFAGLFGVWRPKAFVVHAGWPVGGAGHAQFLRFYGDQVARHGREALLRTVADNLKVMARAAAKQGVSIAVENLDRFLPIGNAADLPCLVDMIDEPNAGYCLDSGHAHAAGNSVAAWVRLAGSKLLETHFHDNRGLGRWLPGEFIDSSLVDEHLPAGFGTINWVGVIRALRQVRFPGPVSFETTGWPDDDPVRGYQRAMEWWRACERLAALPDRASELAALSDA